MSQIDIVRKFFEETWMYIAAPMVLMVVFVVAYLLFFDDSPTPFVYNIF